MTLSPLSLAYVPLVDAAPFIVAQELGFAREEGLDIELIKAPSWSSLRDMLAFGQVDAAHMLAPMPIAMSLGLGGLKTQVSALMVTSVNGAVVGVSQALAQTLRAQGYGFDFQDAQGAGQALIKACDGRLRVGVPFQYSMQAELLNYWLSAAGLPSAHDIQIKTVPPPLMAQAMADGEIDAFCVGAPWGSQVVEDGVGALLLPANAIWSFAPEKVLAVREDWAQNAPDRTAKLMRAVWKACRWLSQGGTQTTASELLSRKEFLDVPAEILDRSLSGRMVLSERGEQRECAGFIEFFEGAATFPWQSQAAWIAEHMAARLGLDASAARTAAGAVFCSDLYRDVLAEIGAVVPVESFKVEGAFATEQAIPSQGGRLVMAKNQLLDRRVFDPN